MLFLTPLAMAIAAINTLIIIENKRRVLPAIIPKYWLLPGEANAEPESGPKANRVTQEKTSTYPIA
jgi:hypothetical protein